MVLQIALPLVGLFLFPITVPPELHIEEKTYHSEQPASIACSCTGYANSLDSRFPLMNASDYVPNSNIPTIGGGVLFYYPNSHTHHVAVVTAIDWQALTMTVTESNFVECKVTSRTISMTEKRVTGFVNL
jgi:hypothetical protein